MNKLKFLFIFISIIIITLGCRKEKKEAKIEGTWHYINLSDVNDSLYKEEWIFNKDKTLFIIWTYPSSSPEIKDKGNWELKQKITKAYITLTNFDPNLHLYINAKWEITELDDKVLKIMTEDLNSNGTPGGLTFREFEKVK